MEIRVLIIRFPSFCYRLISFYHRFKGKKVLFYFKKCVYNKAVFVQIEQNLQLYRTVFASTEATLKVVFTNRFPF